MIKVCSVVLAFTAFLAFAPESRAATAMPEDASSPPLVVVHWL